MHTAFLPLGQLSWNKMLETNREPNHRVAYKKASCSRLDKAFVIFSSGARTICSQTGLRLELFRRDLGVWAVMISTDFSISLHHNTAEINANNCTRAFLRFLAYVSHCYTTDPKALNAFLPSPTLYYHSV